LKNYEKKISLNDVAEILYLNPKYFSNLFKKETGVNFVEYVNSVRLDVARSLLRENKYSIGQVAYKVGFTDLRHFSKLFKEHSGVTPKDFKQYQA
jgi:two-component system response regulator YesN